MSHAGLRELGLFCIEKVNWGVGGDTPYCLCAFKGLSYGRKWVVPEE